MNKKIQVHKGFTLLEVLLVIALIAILAGLIVVAVNPAKQLAGARNVQRQSDINTIVNAIYQYVIDGNALSTLSIPSIATCRATCIAYTAWTDNAQQICRTERTGDCLLGVENMDDTLAAYLGALPVDPSATSEGDDNGTGYYICQDSSSYTVTVCAPGTEISYGASVLYVTR